MLPECHTAYAFAGSKLRLGCSCEVVYLIKHARNSHCMEGQARCGYCTCTCTYLIIHMYTCTCVALLPFTTEVKESTLGYGNHVTRKGIVVWVDSLHLWDG